MKSKPPIDLFMTPVQSHFYQPSENTWQLHYEDEWLLIIEKPANLLTVPGRGIEKQDCLSARIQQKWPEALIVHRLDMATSGLVIMARDATTQRHLSDAFAQRLIHKDYEAIVTGCIDGASHYASIRANQANDTAPSGSEEWHTIDLPLISDWPNRPKQMVNFEIGKPSMTHWRILEINKVNQTTRVALRPITGRTHQLRVHMQAIGHPILGDTLYTNTTTHQTSGPRLLLHACHLKFTHPSTQQPLDFFSDVPF